MGNYEVTSDYLLDQFLIGARLGDGSFCQRTPKHNTYIVFKHCASQIEYLQWKFDFLKERSLIGKRVNKIKKVNMKAGSYFKNYQPQYMFPSISHPMFTIYKNMSYSEIAGRMNKEALAVWILDDGNVNHKCVKISCGSIPIDDCKALASRIEDILSVKTRLYEHKTKLTGNYIAINSRDYEKVKKAVTDMIPKQIDVVREKFSEDGLDSLNVKVKYITEQPPLAFIDGKSDWVDLRAADDITMHAGEFKLIPLGIAMKLPAGYEAHIVPRSSTYKTWHIIQSNSIGIIDGSFCGGDDEWKFPAIAMQDTKIHKGDRICQFRIQKNQPKLNFITVDDLDNPNRGGIGSTGTV